MTLIVFQSTAFVEEFTFLTQTKTSVEIKEIMNETFYHTANGSYYVGLIYSLTSGDLEANAICLSTIRELTQSRYNKKDSLKVAENGHRSKHVCHGTVTGVSNKI
jgi:hypothetical protein